MLGLNEAGDSATIAGVDAADLIYGIIGAILVCGHNVVIKEQRVCLG